MAPQPIYTPPPGFKSYLDEYRLRVNQRYGLSLKTYHDLQSWSVEQPNDFWTSLWDYLRVKASAQPTRAIDESISIDQLPQFYEGARLNYAENLLSQTGSTIAVKEISEANMEKPVATTWDQLREKVRLFADAMRASSLKQGDVVVVIGGSTVKSMALLLATASIGGVFSSFATDAGERVLLDRVGQLKPRFLFAEASYAYNGKQHKIDERVHNVWKNVEKPSDAELIGTTPGEVPSRWTSFDDFLSRGTGAPLTFAQLPFHTPFVVMFSSGTTGTPKGIVHSQGGLIINGMKEHILHYNHDSTAVHFHYAGIGWTLWNIMIGALFSGAQIVLYDGSPFYPSAEECLKSILATGVTSFGAGPRYFSELQKAKVNARSYVGKVDKIPSAGALLTESTSRWIVEAFGPQICQISTSGGTELCGNFVHGTQTLPVYAGENAVKCLGMDVDIFDPEGKPVPIGEAGELVCKKPFPNMPAKFLNDPDGKRYRAAYFDKFPHVWTHGDFVRVNPETGGLIILGRSDGVLNPSGIRFGSGEIYTILEREFKSKIQDAIVVGQQRVGKDASEKVILFLVLPGEETSGIRPLPEELEKGIKRQIAQDLSRRHVPAFMFAVDRIPYNINGTSITYGSCIAADCNIGKKLEIPLRAVISEGEKSFARRKFTVEEKEVLKEYLLFYEIESLTAPKAKL